MGDKDHTVSELLSTELSDDSCVPHLDLDSLAVREVVSQGPHHDLDTSIYLAFCSAAQLLGKGWAHRYRIWLDRSALGSLSLMSQRSQEGLGLFLLLPLKASQGNLPESLAGPWSPKQRILLVPRLWHLTRLATYGNQLLSACRSGFQFSGPGSVGMQTVSLLPWRVDRLVHYTALNLLVKIGRGGRQRTTWGLWP